ncbi:MAG: YkgJ family cysteine cluster protein [Ilumatobacteraceae bacterium]
MNDERDLAAGDFASWLSEMQGAIRGEHGSDVPCEGCTACCTSSQFVHITPDETETLAQIPAELVFPAPRMPPGHVVLGYDERGHCPMLIDDRCSIYEHRPRTCRTYDCRVLPAAGLTLDDDDKVEIAHRIRRWQFSYSTPVGRNQHDAVRAAATYLDEQRGMLPDGAVPTNTTRLAVLAIEVHDVFLRQDASDRTHVIDPDPDVVRVEVMRRTQAHGAM